MYMYTNIHHVVFRLSAGSMAHANFAVKFSLGIRETQGPITFTKTCHEADMPLQSIAKAQFVNDYSV